MKDHSREQKLRIKSATKQALDEILHKYERKQLEWESPRQLRDRIDEAIR